MPLAVVDQLRSWGHEVELLRPWATATCLWDLTGRGFDAYVLKTASDGPGLSILEAAAAAGTPTVNDPGSIHLVRDKAVAAAIAHAHGLSIPRTYFLADLGLLQQIPTDDYPLVVKPNNGSSCRHVYLLKSPTDPVVRAIVGSGHRFYLAQRYVENPGFDVKLYSTGADVYAVVKKSPLHPDVAVAEGPIPVMPELRRLARQVGTLFGLDIFGLDLVETERGWVGLDINDFPSFGLVPQAAARISESILEIVERRRRYPQTPGAAAAWWQGARGLSTHESYHLSDC